MKRILISCLLLINFICFSQVGINTTTPNAQLEVKSTNQATPTNTDGLLTPKIDAFPAINPSTTQQGMLVYLTTISGSNQPGFYYWDNPTTSWIGITASNNSDADFYKIGTTVAPTTINDDMFHLGKVAIGRNFANATLDILSTNNLVGINNYLFNDTLPFNNAIYNFMSGVANAEITGVYNNIGNSGNGLQFGTVNSFYGSGTGENLELAIEFRAQVQVYFMAPIITLRVLVLVCIQVQAIFYRITGREIK